MILLFSIWGLSTFWSISLLVGSLIIVFLIIASYYANDDTDEIMGENLALESEEKKLKNKILELNQALENQKRKTERFEKLYIKEKEAKLVTENMHLKTQLSPHFLNNTLNNIHSLLNYDIEKARQSIVQLKSFLSYLLYETELKDRVSLDKELHFINSYIELYKIKLADDFNIESHFSVVNPETKIIAPLILSPFIENAFKHGDLKSKNAFIRIEVIVDNNQLYYTVKNKINMKFPSEKIGIGTKNLQKRLDLLYPKKHQYFTHCVDNVFTAQLILNLEE
jgi:LytS/YehU family sensor histidine kinase